jgi:D-serine dehydratase
MIFNQFFEKKSIAMPAPGHSGLSITFLSYGFSAPNKE